MSLDIIEHFERLFFEMVKGDQKYVQFDSTTPSIKSQCFLFDVSVFSNSAFLILREEIIRKSFISDNS